MINIFKFCNIFLFLIFFITCRNKEIISDKISPGELLEEKNICDIHSVEMSLHWVNVFENLPGEWDDYINNYKILLFPNCDDPLFIKKKNIINNTSEKYEIPPPFSEMESHYLNINDLLFRYDKSIRQSQYVCEKCNDARNNWIEKNKELNEKLSRNIWNYP